MVLAHIGLYFLIEAVARRFEGEQVAAVRAARYRPARHRAAPPTRSVGPQPSDIERYPVGEI